MTPPRNTPLTLAEWYASVTARSVPGPRGCLDWTGSINARTGYGQVRVPQELADRLGLRGRVTQIHRAVYAYHHGRVPPRIPIDHLCMRRQCCELTHLELVTQTQNNRRAADWRCWSDWPGASALEELGV